VAPGGPVVAAGATFAIADPPYIGLARRYYRDQPDYVGEVDHGELVSLLERRRTADTGIVECPGGPERRLQGWALACSEASLRYLLPLVPPHPTTRVCAWVKPGAVPAATYGPHGAWEAVLVVGGRRRRPGVRNWLRAYPARGGGTLMGRKPLAWCAWVFRLLGMVPGDLLEDLFPGTGIVSRAWAELSSGAPDDALPEYSATAVAGRRR